MELLMMLMLEESNLELGGYIWVNTDPGGRYLSDFVAIECNARLGFAEL